MSTGSFGDAEKIQASSSIALKTETKAPFSKAPPMGPDSAEPPEHTMLHLLNKIRPVFPGHNNASVAAAAARWGVTAGIIGFFLIREELPDPFAKTAA